MLTLRKVSGLLCTWCYRKGSGTQSAAHVY